MLNSSLWITLFFNFSPHSRILSPYLPAQVEYQLHSKENVASGISLYVYADKTD